MHSLGWQPRSQVDSRWKCLIWTWSRTRWSNGLWYHYPRYSPGYPPLSDHQPKHQTCKGPLSDELPSWLSLPPDSPVLAFDLPHQPLQHDFAQYQSSGKPDPVKLKKWETCRVAELAAWIGSIILACNGEYYWVFTIIFNDVVDCWVCVDPGAKVEYGLSWSYTL